MKPFIQKLPLSEDTSFVARTFRTPHFEVNWHQHIEYELILFTEGSGMSFVGNHVGEFETGDIYFLGPNLPHTFQKRQEDLITSAVVVQFREDFWGKELLRLPECRTITELFTDSRKGLKIQGPHLGQLREKIQQLEYLSGFQRIIQLCDCLNLLAEQKEYYTVSTQEIRELNLKEKERIDKVFQYTIANFRDPIELATIAEIANMSVPAFCNYFKKSTKKTYIDFLNEIRIGYACQLLIETQQSILDICFDSGYNTVANFNKQFLKVKNMPPSQFRRHFSGRNAGKSMVN